MPIPFEAEHIIAVRRNFDLVFCRLLLAIDYGTVLVLGVLVQLDAKIEA